MDDGARTHDRRNHNPELYQLSYAHHCYARLFYLLFPLNVEAGPTGEFRSLLCRCFHLISAFLAVIIWRARQDSNQLLLPCAFSKLRLKVALVRIRL